MRIENNSTKPSVDVLRSRVSRQRASYFMLSWWLPASAASNARVLDALSPMQRSNNTTRGSTPGLVNPAAFNSVRVLHPGEDNVDDEEVADEESAYTTAGSSNSDLAEEFVASLGSSAHEDPSDGFSDSDGAEEPVNRQLSLPLTNRIHYDNYGQAARQVPSGVSGVRSDVSRGSALRSDRVSSQSTTIGSGSRLPRVVSRQ